MHLFYLHGFASSPDSSKAAFLADRLAPYGLALQRPDLNEPDFATITITRMIGQVERAIGGLAPGPVVLVGSSLGAFVALHLAERRRRPSTHPVERLIFLAPALDFGGNRMRELRDAGLARWRDTGRLEVFHYGYGEPRWVHYQLYEDAGRFDSFAATTGVPTLIFQGRQDESVDPAAAERFARGRPNVTLHLVDDGHQLLGSLDFIWRETAAFLHLDARR